MTTAVTTAVTTAETTPARADGDAGRLPLTTTVAAEWMKLRGMRSTWVLATTCVVVGVAVSVVVAVAVGATWDDWDAADRAEFNPIISPLVGSLFSGVLVVALGVKVGAVEYAGGLARLTLTATPRRGRVMAAKCLLVTALTWATSALAMVGMFAAAQVVFAGYGMTTAGFGNGDAVRAVATAVALSPVFPLVGLALATMFRSAAGAIAAVLGLLFAPAVVGELLPPWWQENVLAYFPNSATDSVAFSHVDESTAYLPLGLALVVVVAWLAVFLGAAYRAFDSRDA